MCDSSIQWDWNSEKDDLNSFSVHDCSTNTTVSLFSAFQGNLHSSSRVHFPLLSSSEKTDKDPLIRFLGPTLAMFLLFSVYAWLFRRRTVRLALPHTSLSLAEHPKVPLSAKIAVPLIVFSTIGLFAYSNAVVGASVELTLEFLQQDQRAISFEIFDFSLINTVTDMWKAGVYPLSILVGVWSGLFPYLKCLLMLVCWLVPPQRLHPSHRRRLLLSLDILGRWALIDLFLMNMMTVGFRFHITTESIPLLRHFLIVDVKVLPQFGLFTFVTAVSFSLISNHVILAFHRNVVSGEDSVDDGRQGPGFRQLSQNDLQELLLLGHDNTEDVQPACPWLTFPVDSWFDVGSIELQKGDVQARVISFSRVRLIDHAFASLPQWLLTSHPSEHAMISRKPLKGVVKAFVLLFFLFSLGLVLLCAWEDTFQFVFSGLAGRLIHWVDPPQSIRRASLLSIAKDLGENNPESNAFGVLYLQSLYLIFSFVVPLLVVLMAGLVLFSNMSLREWKVWFYALEVGTAWASLDVFIVSLIASVLEINQFSHFLAEDLCRPLQQYFGVQECFGVQTELLRGSWLILGASLCFVALIQFVQRLAERAIADREEEVLDLLHKTTI